MYKDEFKYYRRKCPPPDYSRVVDVSKIPVSSEQVVQIPPSTSREMSTPLEKFLINLMLPPSQWKIYEITDKPGLLFVTNPFTPLGQRYWVCRCLRDYPRKPNRLNIDAHGDLKKGEDWWKTCLKGEDRSKILQKKLRWVTMGYHHNWNTKEYSEDERNPFPSDLAALASYVASIVGFRDEFLAQAAIVNFYHMDSTLSGHTDHSEIDITAPLFSFSFGQTAIFLLGGPSLEDKPTPLYINSGDIVIMSGYSRQCYHGIPKVMPATSRPWENIVPSRFEIIEMDVSATVSNQEPMKLQTKCEETSKRPRDDDNEVLVVKRYKENQPQEDNLIREKELRDEHLWKPFKDYIEKSRINMNVRQVLPKGQDRLENKSN